MQCAGPFRLRIGMPGILSTLYDSAKGFAILRHWEALLACKMILLLLLHVRIAEC